MTSDVNTIDHCEINLVVERVQAGVNRVWATEVASHWRLLSRLCRSSHSPQIGIVYNHDHEQLVDSGVTQETSSRWRGLA